MTSRLSRTQAAVLAAYVELIEEVGSDDVSYRLVARRAGVGERTVFRTYPTRVELLAAAAAWVDSTRFAHPQASSVFDVPLEVRESMRAYDAQPELAHVVAEAAVRDEDAVSTGERRARVEALVHDELEALGAAERRGLVAALTFVDSAATWVVLRRELGMAGRDIADAAAWAAEAVLQPVRSRAGT